MLLAEFILDRKSDFPLTKLLLVRSLYAVSISVGVICSMLSGVPFLSASTILSLIELGISGSVNVRVPRT